MSVTIDGPYLGKAAVCMPILRTLPDWFGIEEALTHYKVFSQVSLRTLRPLRLDSQMPTEPKYRGTEIARPAIAGSLTKGQIHGEIDSRRTSWQVREAGSRMFRFCL